MVPPGAPALAHYIITGEGGVAEFSAFEAVPTKAGEVLAVRPLTLWPANWQEASAEAREMHRASLIRFRGVQPRSAPEHGDGLSGDWG